MAVKIIKMKNYHAARSDTARLRSEIADLKDEIADVKSRSARPTAHCAPSQNPLPPL